MLKKKRTPIHYKSNRSLSGSELGRSKAVISWVIACSSNNTKEIERRLEKEPDLAYFQDDYTGQTSLHWMIKHNNKEMVVHLIEKLNISPNIVNKSGQTGLHAAALYTRQELYQLLLIKYSADPKVRDNAGRVPSFYLQEQLISAESIQQLHSGEHLVASDDSICPEEKKPPMVAPRQLVYGPNANGIKLSWYLLGQDMQNLHCKKLTKFNFESNKNINRRQSADLCVSGGLVDLLNRRKSMGRILETVDVTKK